jgi:hypothetical protein
LLQRGHASVKQWDKDSGHGKNPQPENPGRPLFLIREEKKRPLCETASQVRNHKDFKLPLLDEFRTHFYEHQIEEIPALLTV